MMINIAIQTTHLIVLVGGILGFCGSILLLIGGGVLERANAQFNKLILSIGLSMSKGGKGIVNTDSWCMKRSRLIGAVALIISVLLVVNLYAGVI